MNDKLDFPSENGTEICVTCKKDTGIRSDLHVDDQRRYAFGARYTQGAGQTCAICTIKMDTKERIRQIRAAQDVRFAF